jgi:hypothetical protein
MDKPPPLTERSLRERRLEALRRMRHAEWGSYVQASFGVLIYLFLAVSNNDWVDPLGILVVAIVLAGLGYAVGHHQSATAAVLLVVMVLGLAVIQVVEKGKPPALIFVAIFAYLYGKAYGAAREYGALEKVLID